MAHLAGSLCLHAEYEARRVGMSAGAAFGASASGGCKALITKAMG